MNIREILYGAEKYLTSLGYENIDADRIDVEVQKEWSGCCELCMWKDDVYIISYMGEEFRTTWL